MSKYRESVLTDGGLNLARQAENARIKITFTRAVLSAEDHTSDSMQALEQLTTLNSFVQSDPINYTNILNATDVAVPLRFSNVNQTTNNYINTIGLYATDGTTEVLHSVIVNDDPELFPVYNGSTPQYVKVNFETEVGRTSQINTNVSPMGMVTEEEFSAATKNWELSSSHNADVSSLSAEIGSVSSAVANNSGIESEFSSVSSGVANNSSAITLLQSSVSTNSSSIGSLQTSVNSNSSSINTLQSSVSNNANSINNLSNNKVQDNHDGTVTVNGSNYNMYSILPSGTDLNNVTTTGNYQAFWKYSYNHVPSSALTTWLIQVVNNGNEVYQEARSPLLNMGYYRQYSFGNWTGWSQIASNTDVVNLQNQVNGVLARQSNLINEIVSQNHLSSTSALESIINANNSGLMFQISSNPLAYLKIGAPHMMLTITDTLLITSGPETIDISNLDNGVKSYLANKNGNLSNLTYLNGQSTSVGVNISSDGNTISLIGGGGYINCYSTTGLY